MRSPLSNKVIVYLSILFLIVGAVFYCSDMRMQTEEFLFDLTVKSIPALEPTDKILTIGLETKTFTSDQKKDLLTSVVKKTLDAGVPNIYATYLLSEYNYQEELPVYLADIISTQSQVKLLTLGLNQKHPISLDFPKDLESYKNNLIGIDALRNRSYGIVRKVPTTSYRGTEKSKLFAHDLLEKRGQSKMPMEVALRNIKSNRITVSSVAELPELKHFELVLIGQSEYRPWVSQTVEPPTVNTPFKNNPYKVSEGSSILDFASLQAQNIVQKKEIHILWSPVALFFQIIATILIIYLLLKTKIERSLFPIVVILINLVGSMLLVHFFSIYLPNADFSFIALVAQIMMVARFAENQFVDKEKQVIESREREKLDSIYSLFISDLANYLIKNNNTIHAILKKIRSTEFGSTQKEMIKGTIKSSSQFGEFLQGISTLSKIDMNKIDNSPITQIRLKTLIQRVLDRFDNEAKQNSIKFINYVGADIELKVNNELLDAIVQNVISNAVKYSPQGKKIEISAEAKANKVLIEIKDYGFGIESSNTEKIFEKFYRVKDDHVYNKKGSGIGLYLSKLFANHLGGDVTLLTSNLGEGSTFCIKVPKNV